MNILELFSDEMRCKHVAREKKHEQNIENVASLEREVTLLKQQCQVLKKSIKTLEHQAHSSAFRPTIQALVMFQKPESGVGFSGNCGKCSLPPGHTFCIQTPSRCFTHRLLSPFSNSSKVNGKM